MTAPRWLRVATVAALLPGAGCTPAPVSPTVSLRMRGGPAEASVTIDDQYVGPLVVVSIRGVALPRGTHRISVESPGYLPWDGIVEARDAPVRVDVSLVPVPE